MNLKALHRSDLIILDTFLTMERAMNCREMEQAMPLSYDTCLKRMRVLAKLGLFKKVEFSRWVVNDDHPAVASFKRIRRIEYKPPVQLSVDGSTPAGQVFVPKKEPWRHNHAKIIDI